ncbi:MAG: (2Fe-2S)-binding protein [Candidatus Tectomicrobia bacterium]|uniref:(2Fe-2S)-binding protein n=1 Tax=Tectimicrobiota bacterium TaxID=2528274 RepID=A0A932CQC6_UNCTE|nr:(2Fe-2S)-binding protein [Candidatus Tectomicrobia bacterium]
MVSIRINGQPAQGEAGSTLLEVARNAGVSIPTLCHHEALPPLGSCRLCLVEISGGGRPGLVASCSYPVQEGLVVETHSARVLRARRLVVELLLARCPQVPRLQELAEELGVSASRFPAEEHDCILCGLCVRACQELGLSSIGFVNRGAEREVTTPFRKPSEVCLGCGVCAHICPVQTVEMEEEDHSRWMKSWNTRLPLQKCSSCGKYFSTEKQLLYLKERVALPEEVFQLCQTCRKKALLRNLAAIPSR